MKKLTKPQEKAIDRIRTCGSLMIERDQYLDHAGNIVDRRVVNNLLKAGLLVPSGDALFDDGDSQTLRLSDACEVRS